MVSLASERFANGSDSRPMAVLLLLALFPGFSDRLEDAGTQDMTSIQIEPALEPRDWKRKQALVHEARADRSTEISLDENGSLLIRLWVFDDKYESAATGLSAKSARGSVSRLCRSDQIRRNGELSRPDPVGAAADQPRSQL